MKKRFIIFVYIFFQILNFTKANADSIFEDFLYPKKSNFKVTASIDYFSKYIFRGILRDADPVLRPNITISAFGFEAGFLENLETESKDSRNSNESIVWLGYMNKIDFINENLKFKMGHIWYNFPDTNKKTKEFYFGFKYHTFLSPYFTWYHDYGNQKKGGGNGDYYILGIEHNIKLIEKYNIGLNIKQEFGYNNKSYINGKGLYSSTIIGLNIPITKDIFISPRIGYSVPFDDLASEKDGNQKEHFFTGFSINMTF